jgi:hypothetical protein
VKINPERFKTSVGGFQSPNGNSTIYRADTINTFHFGMSLLQTRFSNMEDMDKIHDLYEIFNSNDLSDECVQNSIPIKNVDEFNQEILKNISNTDASKETIIKRLKRSINKENTEDKRKISKIKAQNLTLALINYFNLEIPEKLIRNPSQLKKVFENKNQFDEMFPCCLKSEKRIFMIIDNFSVHKTYLSRIICKILNIELIFLPKYSPFLNPIEQLWRTMKNIIHRDSIPDINFLEKIVDRLFHELVDETTFFKEWIEKYIAKK